MDDRVRDIRSSHDWRQPPQADAALAARNVRSVNWSAHRRNAPIVHRSALGQHQWVTLPYYVDVQGHVPERDLPWPVPRIPWPPHHPSPSRTRTPCHQSTRTRRTRPEAKAPSVRPGAHGDPGLHPSSGIPDETSRSPRERLRRSALRWPTIGTTTARSDFPEVRNDRRLSRGERHADADSNCFAKCSANRFTASHSV
jgi:hypothetical protein